MSRRARPKPCRDIAPKPNLETKPFWDATAEGRLLLKRCDGRCGTVIWYPRSICPVCGSLETSWFEASGRGTIYSCTVTRRGQGATATRFILKRAPSLSTKLNSVSSLLDSLRT